MNFAIIFKFQNPWIKIMHINYIMKMSWKNIKCWKPFLIVK